MINNFSCLILFFIPLSFNYFITRNQLVKLYAPIHLVNTSNTRVFHQVTTCIFDITENKWIPFDIINA